MHHNEAELAFKKRCRKYNLDKQASETVLLESIKCVCKHYCEESSICGFKHLVASETPYIERVIWTVTMVGALACSATLVWVTFRRFYTAPLVTTEIPEGVAVTTIVFPATGLCTTNRISRRAVTELARTLLQDSRNAHYNESEMLSIILGLGQLYDLQPVDKSGEVDAKRLHHILGKYDVSELMRSLTPRCEDMLVRCAWNQVHMNCSQLFNFRLTMNGYCCTFNYLRQSEEFEKEGTKTFYSDTHTFGNKSSFDYEQGLKVLIKHNDSDIFFKHINIKGIQLQFSNAYDFPDAPSGGFAAQIISHTVQMTVLISASVTTASRDIEHLDVSQRGCLFHYESTFLPFYTYSDCLTKCRVLFFLASCNCSPFNLPKTPGARTCDLRDLPCLRHYYPQSLVYRPDVARAPKELELDLVGGGIDCNMCHPTCSKTSFKYEFNNVLIFPEVLNKIPNEDRSDWLTDANFTETSIVHVKYANELADCYEQNVIMKWFDLFSNIGSTCGFVTGFSFISVFEFIYFFTVKLTRELRRRIAKKRASQAERLMFIMMEEDLKKMELSKGDEKTLYQENHDSLSLYHPLYWSEISCPK